MTSCDRFPVPVRSAVKSNLTDWCRSKREKTTKDVFRHSFSVLRRDWSSFSNFHRLLGTVITEWTGEAVRPLSRGTTTLRYVTLHGRQVRHLANV